MRNPVFVIRDLMVIFAAEPQTIDHLNHVLTGFDHLAPELMNSAVPWGKIKDLLDQRADRMGTPDIAGEAARQLFCGNYGAPELSSFQESFKSNPDLP